MKRAIILNYKSIFKYADHQEKVEFKGNGYLIDEQEYQTIRFYYEDAMMEIKVCEEHIILMNGISKLKLVENIDIDNEYQTEYGVFSLKTRLINRDTKKSIKLKYQLYDHDQLLSDVYLFIDYRFLEN